MRSRIDAASLVLASSLALHGCGWDGIFLTPRGYEPTPEPRAVLAGGALPLAEVEVLSRAGDRLAVVTADESGGFEIVLPAGADGANLRILARSGASAVKVVVPFAAVGELTEVGVLDPASTARAQLATHEIVSEAGSSFRATPPRALLALLTRLETEPSPELAAFTDVIREVLAGAAAAPAGVPAAFDVEGADLSEAMISAAGLSPELLARYRSARALAAAGYGLEIRCDPSRLNVLFTVDLSGRGLDGNGAPQLIRQPPKEGRVFLGFTSDESSAIGDDSIPRKLTPNDARFAMTDDGLQGDEVAGDQLFSVVVPLPRGARLLYKYTDGAAGEGFTGSEEWPGNARILEIEDVITGRPDGEPDCLVIRRDSFGDEASNKNFVNLHAKAKERGGTVGFDADLGGAEVPRGAGGVGIGGLTTTRDAPPLTPLGIAEARENGVCTVCPAPLVLDPDDTTPPALERADRLAIDRVRARFSEPLDPADARSLDRYLYVDSSGLSIPILSAAPSGSDVLLSTAPHHPRNPARLVVRNLRDASVRGNLLEQGEVAVREDDVAPKVLSARALSILELEPDAVVEDPTIGDLVELTLDERPEESSASDVKRFQIEGLEVLAAVLVDAAAPGAAPRIRLITAAQAKSVPYLIRISGLRDAAGNTLDQEVAFDGFALYRARFSVVPGFAFRESDGAVRGIPRGEQLFLTGAPLAAARGLDGRDLSITALGGVRTDVTGWPEFELRPSTDLYQGQPIHHLEVLLPPGSYAWKAAHGIAGEQARPPPTLEKVYKTLSTTNDATGVRVDPATMVAENGLSYAGARLSETGDEPPRAGVVFKREAPDELCDVRRDTRCPLIVLGAFRDFFLDQGGKTRDYDDGITPLPPHHPELPDVAPPKLLDARARDSFSLLLSFDEALVDPAQRITASLASAEDGVGLPVTVLDTREVRPHQVVLRLDASACDAALRSGEAYTVRYRGAADRAGRVDRRERTQTILAPEGCVAPVPLSDRDPPRIAAITATDLTELVIRFDERIDPATAAVREAYGIVGDGGAALAVQLAEVLPDRSSVRLQTATQVILAPYRLTASGISDAADPANVLTSTTVSFTGFGERTAPRVERARAIASDRVLVRFDEPLEPGSAVDASHYRIDGLQVLEVAFSGDPGRRTLAFNAALAPRIRDVVLLRTTVMSEGTSYTLTVDGVRDLSGNAVTTAVPFEGVASAPLVDVVLEYEVSEAKRVGGTIPSRALSPATLADSREGLFVLGAAQGPDNSPVLGRAPPVNDALGGFGVEGQPLDGIEPRLSDNGGAPDLVAADAVFSILVPAVPLGTTMIWKAFAPFSTSYRDRVPDDSAATFADALPGPSAFGDGQEYPGNENGAVILDDGDSDGVVRVRCLFGDEISYKKHTGGAAYVWVYEDR